MLVAVEQRDVHVVLAEIPVERHDVVHNVVGGITLGNAALAARRRSGPGIGSPELADVAPAVVVRIVELVLQPLEEGEAHLAVEDAEQTLVQIQILCLLVLAERVYTQLVGHREADQFAVLVAQLHVRTHVVGGDQVGRGTRVVALRIVGLHADLQPRGDVRLEIQAGAETVVVVTHDDTVLVVVVHRSEVVGRPGASRHRDAVVLHEARIGYGIVGVHRVALAVILALGLVQVGEDLVAVVVEPLGTPVVEDLLDVLRTVHHVGLVGARIDAPVAVHPDRRFLGRAHARGDHDHTIGCTGTVYGGRAGILQHIDRLDVGRRKVGNRTVVDRAIDDHQRVVAGADRGRAADGHLGLGTGARSHADVQTRNRTLQRLQHVGVGEGGLFVHIDLRDRSRDILLAHRTVADDHHVVQLDVVAGKGDVDDRLGADGHLLRLISYIGELQDGLRTLDRKLVVAVDVGRRTVGRVQLEHRDPDDGPVVRIDDFAPNDFRRSRAGLGGHSEYSHTQKTEHKTDPLAQKAPNRIRCRLVVEIVHHGLGLRFNMSVY